MSREYWGVHLDDIAEAIYMDMGGDNVGAHYFAFEGDKLVARQKIIDAFTRIIDRKLYRANSYGSPWREGDDDV